jgi:hypothetical protein
MWRIGSGVSPRHLPSTGLPAAALLTAVAAVTFLAACSSGSAAATHDPLAKLNSAIGKLNETRAIVLDDLVLLARAVDAVDSADDAAADGDVDSAKTLVPVAASLIAAAAPIAARGRSDVISYQQAIGAVVGAAAKLGPTDGLTDDRADAIEAVGRAGAAEAADVSASVQVYATAWPDYSSLTTRQHSWLQRVQHHSFAGTPAARAAYVAERASSTTALDSDGQQIADTERTRDASTKAMAIALGQARDALSDLPLTALVPTPSPPPTSTAPARA